MRRMRRRRDNGLSPAELSGGMMLSGYTTAFVSAFRGRVESTWSMGCMYDFVQIQYGQQIAKFRTIRRRKFKRE